MPFPRAVLRRPERLAVLLLLLWAAPGCRRDATGRERGVVVEEVAEGGAAAKAGLRGGDRVLAWEVQGAAGRRGSFSEPFEVAEVEVEQAPRGRVVLHGQREGQPRSWTLAPGDWKLTPRPELAAPRLEQYEASRPRRSPPAAGSPADAPERAEALASALQAEGGWREACWVLLQAGAGRAQSRQWPEAKADFDKARAIASAAGSLVVEARAWEAEGASALSARDLPQAEEAFRHALDDRQKLAPGGGNLGVAMAQGRLASVAFQRGNLAAAEDLWTRSLQIREREAPGSLPAGNCLIGLGAIISKRGDLATAGGMLQRALAIREALAPGTVEHTQVLGNLGFVRREQGDLAGAEELYRKSLDVLERLAPEGPETGTALIHLGVLAVTRGELEAAEAYMRRALRIHEKHDPGSRFVTACLNNLGEIQQARGQFAEAEASYRRSLKLAEETNPNTLEVAANLNNLGDVEAAAGKPVQARALLESALALHRRLAPGSLDMARNLSAMGELAAGEKEFARAWRLEVEALGIRRKLAPGSAREAESLYAMGRMLHSQGRAAAAREHWTLAVRALEDQRGRLALSDQGKTAFGARYSGIFRDLVELMVELGDREPAFHLLERSRARSLLAMLAERDLTFSTDDVPAELLGEQHRCDAEYDQVQKRLAAADAVRGGEEVEKLRAQLEELRSRRSRIADALRRASPRLASLQQPEPLDLEGARRALDPGTLLLSYSVGRTRTLLFVLSAAAESASAPGPLRVFSIPVGEDTLRRRIEIFRGLIARGHERNEIEPALAEQGRRLFKDLLGPAHAAILSSRRLLIVPDGPLHALPWSALVVDGPPSVRYLAETEPLHFAASVTVYAEIKRARARAARRAGPILVAFGDPELSRVGHGVTPDPAATNSSIAARAQRLLPLPQSRLEVEGVTALFPGSAVSYLGAAATEDRVKALGPGPRFIHFACHGLLDQRFPFDSALVLAPSPDGAGTGNGLLQAWEILERIRIDAELVTLSACESGLGRDMGGEGLVGLSRAFQHAGASSVLASLWAVSDRSTAEWMTHFYGALERGVPKDEAVQAAQIEMRRRPEYGHPFHWAAFQLSGLSN
jgi:CHAT domain-containing protein/tetratricopeptide (TPR) repeat protein